MEDCPVSEHRLRLVSLRLPQRQKTSLLPREASPCSQIGGGGAAKALPLAPGLPPLPLTGQAPLSGLDCSPCPSPESPLWVCPGPGFLAASLERHEAGCNLTDMWHSLGTCPAHVLPRGGVGGAWCLELPRWLLQEPNVILAASSVLEGAE